MVEILLCVAQIVCMALVIAKGWYLLVLAQVLIAIVTVIILGGK